MKQADCSLLAEGTELLVIDFQVRELNETFRLGLLDDQLPPLHSDAACLHVNLEVIGLHIFKIQIFRAAIVLKPVDEILEMCWNRSGVIRLVRRYG